jgi:hypothetical protein
MQMYKFVVCMNVFLVCNSRTVPALLTYDGYNEREKNVCCASVKAEKLHVMRKKRIFPEQVACEGHSRLQRE